MDIDLDKIDAVNNEQEQRFEVRVDNHLAVIDYHYQTEERQTIVFTHTGVPEALSGQGLASKMAQTVLDFAAQQSLKVVPQCPFVAGYVREHPEYWPLVPPEYRGD
jgi:predicted GNAT family acetyltransferase